MQAILGTSPEIEVVGIARDGVEALEMVIRRPAGCGPDGPEDARGLSNADIAARLYLSEGTVRNYVRALFTRLGGTDRTQAAVLALYHGLADLGD
ncbi:MAG: winged helix-turn-helix transcriptional regulator [Anaerolineales bacterium]|nr:winged helix-turn-helix transcriptional regulator [Anaerolineales bacterium]